MDSKSTGDITHVLQRLTGGERTAFDQLLVMVYGELQAIARNAMRGERVGHTLEPTALVNELYLKLLGQASIDWQNRAHFFAVAARGMRQILVDHTRRAMAQKRRVTEREPLTEIASPTGSSAVDLLALDEALDRLHARDERKARVVELKYFGGLSSEEIAAALGVTRVTVDRDWRYAHAWLIRELTREAEADDESER